MYQLWYWKIYRIFYNKHAECKDHNTKQVLNRYYDNKDKVSNHRKIFSEKNKDIILQHWRDKR